MTATQTSPHEGAEVPDLADLARVSAELEQEPASSAIKWAWETFGEGAVLAASFQDCVLIDIATQAVPEMEVVFLDTQYHFAETLWYVDQVRERYDLNVRVISPQIAPDNLWQIDPDECCAMRKVEPLARALDGKSAWLTGLRRDVDEHAVLERRRQHRALAERLPRPLDRRRGRLLLELRGDAG